MPPKTRGSKISKASKENVGVNYKTKAKKTSTVAKLPRKALADKTNSASDDNASFLPSKPSVNIVGKEEIDLISKKRPRRERRLPSRYVENNGKQNLSKSKNASVENIDISKHTPTKTPMVVLTPLKNTKLNLDSSLTARRPKRVCRLPSKFDDHSVSPSKFIPVQPAYTSTPKILEKPSKKIVKNDSNIKGKTKKIVISAKVISTKTNKKTVNKNNDTSNKTNSSNSSADTNNNAKTNQLPQSPTKNKENTSPKSSLLCTKAPVTKKLNKNYSIRILDSKKSLKRDASKLDVYEFTYDPNEEPPPQKKKRKRPVKKREPKPKKVVFKDTYDKNLAKALTNLKNTISVKAKPNVRSDNAKVDTQSCTAHPVSNTVVTTIEIQPNPSNPCTSEKSHTLVANYNSVRVEDIALDFEQDSYADDINYSPVHSFCPPTNAENGIPHPDNFAPNNSSLTTPAVQNNTGNQIQPASNNDPLNLRDNLSFFDDQPVASSSINISTRNPAASPWRVEFGSLPIKWQVNTYVKPNMTPAFESSFMNFNDSKKKHVYTNMVSDAVEQNDLPQIYEDYASKLKQTSIISFIKEVVDKKEKKRKEKITPVKSNSLFEDVNNVSVLKDAATVDNNYTTPKKNAQSNHNVTPPTQDESTTSNESQKTNNSHESGKENSRESVKCSSKKKRDRNMTYFGFDDSENHDQENVSPVKNIDKRKLRALKPRGRAVLQEINEQKGPTRAMLPVAVKTKPIQNSEAANKLFDQMKAATEPPVFPDKDPIQSTEITNITEIENVDSNDDQSVHLFEDIELVHHLKAHRKSYGKAKKVVTFRQNSVSDSDVLASDVAEHSESSDEDDLHDLTFKLPAIEPKKTTRKKKSKKPKISKKEEQEVEAWAAGFNSMCEDIEEFDLVVE